MSKINPNVPIAHPDLPYVWKQTLDEIELSIKLPSPAPRAKDIVVEMRRDSLKINAASVCIEGSLHKSINPSNSTWTIFDGQLDVTLEKLQKMEWWPCVIAGHPSIDTKEIEPESTSVTALDGETRAMVEKMMFDQRQKQMGKPTSQEMAQAQMLDRLQKANPTFDFSKAKFT